VETTLPFGKFVFEHEAFLWEFPTPIQCYYSTQCTISTKLENTTIEATKTIKKIKINPQETNENK
jgi:hypothetical protein